MLPTPSWAFKTPQMWYKSWTWAFLTPPSISNTPTQVIIDLVGKGHVVALKRPAWRFQRPTNWRFQRPNLVPTGSTVPSPPPELPPHAPSLVDIGTMSNPPSEPLYAHSPVPDDPRPDDDPTDKTRSDG
ncbi:hypothetical protein PIB30_043441 [Stylosanthes scabra]|uniref:Uncharacterized protein n=1 Tax=Stylosanthes scabra TaxID=79078 RepID=A0ABU6VDY6_9FABA|nr:hypothetical protein [Stylosanthes scabra]